MNTLYLPTTSKGTTYGVGSNGQVLKSNGETIYWDSDNNTTYSKATVNKDGLMSAADKQKLNGIPNEFPEDYYHYVLSGNQDGLSFIEYD
jgi:hypothetical protein